MLYLPPKIWWRSPTDASLMAERKSQLHKYLNTLISTPDLQKSPQFVDWLKATKNPSSRSLSNPDKEGYLLREGHALKIWREFWFVLKADKLYYFKNSDLSTLYGFIDLSEMIVRDAPERDKPNCISFRHYKNLVNPIFICIKDTKEFKEWYHVLNIIGQKYTFPSSEKLQCEHISNVYRNSRGESIKPISFKFLKVLSEKKNQNFSQKHSTSDFGKSTKIYHEIDKNSLKIMEKYMTWPLIRYLN